MEKELIIIGAGSLGLLTLDAALEMNRYKKIYFIDDSVEKETKVYNHNVLGGLECIDLINKEECEFIIAISNNEVRKKIAQNYKLNYTNIVHPEATISRYAKIGYGNIILANSTIDPNVQVCNHVVLNKNNSIGHDTVLMDCSQVSPGCSFGGGVVLNEGSFIGLGAAILPQVKIGSWTNIGAGASVIGDIPTKVTAVGVPAKVVYK